MGVTSRRVAFGALLAAAVLLPLRKPATVVATRARNDQAARFDTLASRYRTAHVAWAAFDLRDSATALLARTPDGDAQPTVGWRGFGGAPNSLTVDSLISRFWTRVGRPHPAVRTAILIFNAQTYTMPRYDGTLVLRNGTEIGCVAIVPGHLKAGTQGFVSEYDLDEPMAPCALIAAFGAPGAGAGDWLMKTRFAAAQSNAWLWPTSAQGDGSARGPWVEWLNGSNEYGWMNSIPRWVATVGALDISTRAMLPYDIGGAALHCIAGEQPACVTGVLHPALEFPAATAMPPDLTQTAWRSRLDVVTVETVRPPNAAFVSALITEFGRDKFQRFWSSDQPFEQAFQAAFGESLGRWTARWSRQRWLASGEARYMSADITLGVTLKPTWPLLAVAWTAVGLAIAGAVARRRTTA